MKFSATENDEPITPGDVAYAIIGRIFANEFEARAFWAAHSDTAHTVWIGPGDWRFDPIKGYFTDANRPGKQF